MARLNSHRLAAAGVISLIVAAAVDSARSAGAQPATEAAATKAIERNDARLGPEVNGLRAKVSLARKQFGIHEPIVPQYVVENVSQVEQTLWHSGFWPNHQILLRDAGGNEPPLTAEGQARRHAFSPDGPRDKNAPWKLKASQQDDTEGQYDLATLYDLSKPGRYAVQYVYEEKQGGWEGRLASNEAEFEVVPPAAAQGSVEEDGVRFEILVPERVWKIPENKPGNSSTLPLELRITNRTEKPLRFSGFGTLAPELLGPDGKEVPRWPGPYETLRSRLPVEGDFPLVMPGKSVTFFIRADLFWPTLDERTLWFRWWQASGSPGQYFENLKRGPCKIRVVYENRSTSFDVGNPSHKVLDDHTWTGRIETPYVEVSVREGGAEHKAAQPAAPQAAAGTDNG